MDKLTVSPNLDYIDFLDDFDDNGDFIGENWSNLKTEIKTEEEELRGKTGGFICPECSEHFFYEEYFLEHQQCGGSDLLSISVKMMSRIIWSRKRSKSRGPRPKIEEKEKPNYILQYLVIWQYMMRMLAK